MLRKDIGSSREHFINLHKSAQEKTSFWKYACV